LEQRISGCPSASIVRGAKKEALSASFAVGVRACFAYSAVTEDLPARPLFQGKQWRKKLRSLA